MKSIAIRRVIAGGAVTLVALLHLYFLVLEMFLWQTPTGMKTFGTTPEFAAALAVLAANQGLYNGFLAAGLIWALASYGLSAGRHILAFFLTCVLVAAVYGAVTVSPRIFAVQGLPALLALAALWSVPRTRLMSD